MFIGFAIGTICLIGLVRAVARRRGYGFAPYGGYAYGFGHHGGFGGHRRGFGRHHGPFHHDMWGDDSPPWRGEGEGRREGPWGRGRGVVYSLLGRLEATPGQEKAILAALDELKEIARELRGIGRDVRGDVARAIRGPMLDDVALEGATARIDDATLKLRAAARAAIAKIHGALDDRQRKMLADIIDSSWRGGW
ncbi:MAG TPA: periplasmic heavy metal sensor [Polyangiaceae bacterium]|nr:periplasmic heavy metal sensor [Polyangiaceae bacterium]